MLSYLGVKIGTPCWLRSSRLSLIKRLLYQMSYRGDPQASCGEDVLGALPLSYVGVVPTTGIEPASPSFNEITLIQSAREIYY